MSRYGSQMDFLVHPKSPVWFIYDEMNIIAHAFTQEDADRIIAALRSTEAPTEEPFVLEPKETWTQKALIAVRAAGEQGLTSDELSEEIGYSPKSSASLLSALRVRGDLKLGLPRIRRDGRAVHTYVSI